MPEIHWRERVLVEDSLQEDLRDRLSESARRRARALEDGVAELGSKSAVARAIGVTAPAVRAAIKEHGRATATPSRLKTTE